MNKLSVVALSLLLSTVSVCCKPNTEPVDPIEIPPGTQEPAAVTPEGKPIGSPVTKTIGPAGGSLTAADGQFTLTIPQGALAKEASISVQAVENKAPNGTGTSYRFGADDVVIAQPYVEATFSYPEPGIPTQGNVGVARQDKQGAWKISQLARVNSGKRTVTARFTDIGSKTIAFIEQFKLTPDSTTILPTETVTMLIEEVPLTGATEQDAGDKAGNLAAAKPAKRAMMQKILINGKENDYNSESGSYTFTDRAKKGEASFDYKAPEQIPPKNRNPVSVMVELKNYASGAYLALVANLEVVQPAEFKLGTTTYTDPIVHVRKDGKSVVISMLDSLPTKPTDNPPRLEISFPMAGKGSYTINGQDSSGWKASAFDAQGKDWLLSFLTKSDGVTYGPITVNITEYSGIGKPWGGTITGTLHRGSWANHQTLTISARFRQLSFG